MIKIFSDKDDVVTDIIVKGRVGDLVVEHKRSHPSGETRVWLCNSKGASMTLDPKDLAGVLAFVRLHG